MGRRGRKRGSGTGVAAGRGRGSGSNRNLQVAVVADEQNADVFASERDEGNTVSAFDYSAENHFRAVELISSLCGMDADDAFGKEEMERLSSAITFLVEWKYFHYEPKTIRYDYETGTPLQEKQLPCDISLPQFSSATVPKMEGQQMGNNKKFVNSRKDFVLHVGGPVWALDWCPGIIPQKPECRVRCEYLAVAAHPPETSYHKMGAPLSGRGVIQIWCLVLDVRSKDEFNPPEPKKRGRKKKERREPDNSSHAEGINDEFTPLEPKKRGRKKKERREPDDSSCDEGINADTIVGSVDPEYKLEVEVAKDEFTPPEPKRRGRKKKERREPEDSSCAEGINADTVVGSVDPEYRLEVEATKDEFTPPEPKRRGRKKKERREPDDSSCAEGINAATVVGSVDPDYKLEFEATKDEFTPPEPKRRGRKKKERREPDDSSCAEGINVGMVLGSVDPEYRSEVETAKDAFSPPVPKRRGRKKKERREPDDSSCAEGLNVGTVLGSVDPEYRLEVEAAKDEFAPPVPKRRGRKKKERREPDDSSCAEGLNVGMVLGSVDPAYRLEVEATKDEFTLPVPKRRGRKKKERREPDDSRVAEGINVGTVLGGVDPEYRLEVEAAKDEFTPPEPKRRGRKKKESREPDDSGCAEGINADTVVGSVDPAYRLEVEAAKDEFPPPEPKRRGRKKKERREPDDSSCAEGINAATVVGSVDPEKRLEVEACDGFTNNHVITSAPERRIENEAATTGVCNDSENLVLSIRNEDRELRDSVSEENNNHGQVATNTTDENTGIHLDWQLAACTATSSLLPTDLLLPRLVLCLAHNGKVAWDVKWQPPSRNDAEHKHRMGYLAVLLGSGSLEVWEVPSPSMIKKLYGSLCTKGTDPRFVKLEPVFRCSKMKSGDRQSIPLTVEWSTSAPHDLLLAGCHDGTVSILKFSASDSPKDTRPLLRFTADTVPIRAVSWAPNESDTESSNVIVTAGHEGLRFWDIRDPYRPLWDLHALRKVVLSLDWLRDPRCIILSINDIMPTNDGNLRLLCLPEAAQDGPVTGKSFAGTQYQGLHSFFGSPFSIWSIQASRLTGMVAYCGADGSAVCFQLTRKAVEKDPTRNRPPQFLCGSLTEEDSIITLNIPMPNTPLPVRKLHSQIPASTNGGNSTAGTLKNKAMPQDKTHGGKKGKDLNKATDIACLVGEEEQDPFAEEDELFGDDSTPAALKRKATSLDSARGGKKRKDLSPTTDSLCLDGVEKEPGNPGSGDNKMGNSKLGTDIFPPKIVAMHRVRWNVNKGTARWLAYGGAAGIVRCQEISLSTDSN